MTDYDTTHPYQYRVFYTQPGDPREHDMEMAFAEPRTKADIQALKTQLTITRVEIA